MAKEDKPRVNFHLKKVQRAFESDTGDRYIEGFIPYNSRSVDFGYGLYEVLAPSVFKKTLKDGAEVRALHNHNDDEILGNTKSGTLELENTPEGLICRVKIPNTSYANDLYEVVKRGDCRTMSFGMFIINYSLEYNEDKDTTTRTITEAALDEVSYGVVYPAYPETTSETAVRSLDLKHMNESMKKHILSLAEELRSVEPEGKEQPEASAVSEPSNDVQPEKDAEADKKAAEEEKRKAEEEAKANAEADAFLFSQAF